MGGGRRRTSAGERGWYTATHIRAVPRLASGSASPSANRARHSAAVSRPRSSAQSRTAAHRHARGGVSGAAVAYRANAAALSPVTTSAANHSGANTVPPGYTRASSSRYPPNSFFQSPCTAVTPHAGHRQPRYSHRTSSDPA